MDSDFVCRDFDMLEVSKKLNLLFHCGDAVLQRAGFCKSLNERSAMPNCFVAGFSEYSDSETALCNFVEHLKISDVPRARKSLLDFLRIQNDGTDIFDLPNFVQ